MQGAWTWEEKYTEITGEEAKPSRFQWIGIRVRRPDVLMTLFRSITNLHSNGWRWRKEDQDFCRHLHNNNTCHGRLAALADPGARSGMGAMDGNGQRRWLEMEAWFVHPWVVAIGYWLVGS
jgi:hypothetical protein